MDQTCSKLFDNVELVMWAEPRRIRQKHFYATGLVPLDCSHIDDHPITSRVCCYDTLYGKVRRAVDPSRDSNCPRYRTFIVFWVLPERFAFEKKGDARLRQIPLLLELSRLLQHGLYLRGGHPRLDTSAVSIGVLTHSQRNNLDAAEHRVIPVAHEFREIASTPALNYHWAEAGHTKNCSAQPLDVPGRTTHFPWREHLVSIMANPAEGAHVESGAFWQMPVAMELIEW